MSSSNSVGRAERDICRCLCAESGVCRKMVVQATWVGCCGDAELMVLCHRGDGATACHAARWTAIWRWNRARFV